MALIASLFLSPLDLLTVPPGFKKGVDFAPKGEFDTILSKCPLPSDTDGHDKVSLFALLFRSPRSSSWASQPQPSAGAFRFGWG